jgi:peptidoglycan/LPS O-acetylase OafA/YrhL
MRPTSPDAPLRFERLDLLRALAAIEVMVFHVWSRDGESLPPLDAVLVNGHLGVVVFFVLSGFLVTRPFVAGPVATLPYLVRRGARIIPAYVAALVGITLLSGDAMFPTHAAAYLTFTQNFDPDLLAMGPLGPTWTLQLEMEFYLLLPLLMVVVLAIGRRLPVAASALLAMLGLASVFVYLTTIVSPDPWVSSSGRLSLPAMAWAFVPGVLLAWTLGRWPHRTAALASGRVAVLGMVCAATGWMLPQTAVVPMGVQAIALAAGTALMIPWLARPRTATDRVGVRERLERVLVGFGRTISYPFYLWHLSLIGLAMAWGLRGWAIVFATLLLGTLVGGLSWHLVERPAMRLARSMPDGRRRASPLAAEPVPNQPHPLTS